MHLLIPNIGNHFNLNNDKWKKEYTVTINRFNEIVERRKKHTSSEYLFLVHFLKEYILQRLTLQLLLQNPILNFCNSEVDNIMVHRICHVINFSIIFKFKF